MGLFRPIKTNGSHGVDSKTDLTLLLLFEKNISNSGPPCINQKYILEYLKQST